MRVGVCLFVKNEARDIAEWLAYQHVIGFDAVIAYDNASTDSTVDVLRAAGRAQDVRPIDWGPGSPKRAQVDAYDHCLATFGAEFDWLAFFDADEFLVPHGGDVKDLLSPLDHASAMVVNWAMFGSSGHVDYPADLVIEAFTRRRPWGARNVKSIVRPSEVVGYPPNPHRFPVSGRTLWPDGREPDWLPPKFAQTVESPDLSICQLNHYFTRSYRHWQDRVERGWLGRQKYTLEQFARVDANEYEDTCATRFAPAVKAQMLRFQQPSPRPGA